jgi:hypothetical protein
VFDPQTVVEILYPLRLVEFHLIDDKGKGIVRDASFAAARECGYGCGLFIFEK